jgi:ATP/maltotriose-dependent transcriptional regulator MalT
LSGLRVPSVCNSSEVADALIGRDGELASVSALLDRLAGGPAALVFVGEPGIGKTALWQEAAQQARAGAIVLTAQPAEAEAHLGFAALSDLFAPVVDEVTALLPEPQRRALSVALLLEQPGGVRVNQRAIFAAVLSAVRILAERGTVVVAIDDLQWLDPPSAGALEFAMRRLGDLPVGLIACARTDVGRPVTGDTRGPGPDLERTLPPDRYQRVAVGPLSVGALQQILKTRTGRSFPHRLLVRIAELAGGNPFFALELVRSLPAEVPSGSAFVLPDNLRGVVEDRIKSLSRQSWETLLVAAVAAFPTIDMLSAATGHEDVLRGVEEAQEAGIITVEGSRIRFSHPLFAAGLFSSASPSQRRQVHRRLGAVVGDPEDRARHQALGAEQPDDGLADTVESAAEHARLRGAPPVAAELAEHARRLTPPDRTADLLRRTIEAAEYRFHAGQLREARELIEAVLREVPAGALRASALRLLGEIHYNEDSFEKAIAALETALDHVGDDREMQLAIELSLTFTTVSKADVEGAARHARRALAVSQGGAEQPSIAEAIAVTTIAEFLMGHGLNESDIETMLRLEDPWHQVPVLVRPSLIAACLALYEGRLARCEQLLVPLRQRVIEQGEEGDLPSVSAYLVWSACWRGDLQGAEFYAEDAIEAARRIGSDAQLCLALAYGAVGAAYSGDAVVTRRRVDESMALAARTGYDLSRLWSSWALAILALSEDDVKGAHAALAPLTAMFDGGVPEPVRAFYLPDAIEALIGLGQLDRAEQLLGAFEESARRLDRQWALMLSARDRALLVAAQGHLEAATAHVGEATELCTGLELHIEIARTFLVAGRIERRRRKKASAARHLGQALDQFESMGAARWAARARAELRRVGLRPPAASSLTASELRVAQLIVSGQTNREVASQLFMSPKTVEATLARVYRKLDVHSRAELGAKLADPRVLSEHM